MIFGYLLAAFFAFEGVLGLVMLWHGAPFWSASGPIIVQGFGCAAAMGWYLSRERERDRR